MSADNLGAFQTGRALKLLFDRSSSKLTQKELEFIARASDDAEEKALNMADILNKLACLIEHEGGGEEVGLPHGKRLYATLSLKKGRRSLSRQKNARPKLRAGIRGTQHNGAKREFKTIGSVLNSSGIIAYPQRAINSCKYLQKRAAKILNGISARVMP